ncbi:hypothetical protein D3C78_1009140 [compost metagenome]
MLACKQISKIIKAHCRKIEAQIQTITDQILARLKGSNSNSVEWNEYKNTDDRKKYEEDYFYRCFFFHD